MKILLVRSMMVIFAMFLVISCSSDDAGAELPTISCADGKMNGDETGIDCGGSCADFCPVENGLEGHIYNSRIRLNPNLEYFLTGPLFIRDGTIFEIPEGTVIKVLPNRGAFIAVTQGAHFFAWGSKEKPIVITSASENPKPGDWGGLVVCGKAPTSSGNIERSEVADIFYGGNEPDDSSGVFRYLRIEYSGAKFEQSTTFSGISFFGVGVHTTVEHVQSFEGKGNAFKFMGGKVNSKWLVGTNHQKNAVSISKGWSGNGNYWFFSGITASAISIDNEPEVPNMVNEFNIDLNGISVKGPLNGSLLQYLGNNGNLDLHNIFSSGMSLGINVEGVTAAARVENNKLSITNIQFESPTTNFMVTNYLGDNLSFFSEGENDGAGNKDELPDWAEGWTKF